MGFFKQREGYFPASDQAAWKPRQHGSQGLDQNWDGLCPGNGFQAELPGFGPLELSYLPSWGP